jgi:hypothetical protein
VKSNSSKLQLQCRKDVNNSQTDQDRNITDQQEFSPLDPEVGVLFIVASILIGITWDNKGALSSLTKQTRYNEPLSQAQSE